MIRLIVHPACLIFQGMCLISMGPIPYQSVNRGQLEGLIRVTELAPESSLERLEF